MTEVSSNDRQLWEDFNLASAALKLPEDVQRAILQAEPAPDAPRALDKETAGRIELFTECVAWGRHIFCDDNTRLRDLFNRKLSIFPTRENYVPVTEVAQNAVTHSLLEVMAMPTPDIISKPQPTYSSVSGYWVQSENAPKNLGLLVARAFLATMGGDSPRARGPWHETLDETLKRLGIRTLPPPQN